MELTGFLEVIIQRINQNAGTEKIRLMTPSNPAQRGCQLSLLIDNEGKKVFDYLTAQGIIGDWREPNCIRLSPIPLYNRFEDVWKVGEALENYGKFQA